MRTSQEILNRINGLDDDWLGFALEVLCSVLPWDVLEPLLKPNHGIVEADWKPFGEDQLPTVAREYLTFAIGKILDHRGISASRSVSKLTEYAWLMGRDDVVTAMGDADYAQYGAPQVQAFAVGMGWPFLDGLSRYDAEVLERMARGERCSDDCAEGCGS